MTTRARTGGGGEDQPLAWRVARTLGDGRFHSGQVLAEDFGVSRTMVWRAVRELETLGLEVHSVTGKGYRLPDAVEWLDAGAVRAAVPPPARGLIGAITVLEETDSTNQRLLEAGAPAPGRMPVCLAEYQRGGRGRRGRGWQSPPGAGVCLSSCWLFERQPAQLSALGLAAGLAARRALAAVGVAEVGLKWPNDLIARGRKLGGVLTELRAESNGPAFVVVGVGINWRVPEATRTAVLEAGGLPLIDLAELSGAGGGEPPGRNRLAGHLAGELARLLADYGNAGFGAWRDQWAAADVLADRFVRVDSGGSELKGTARGVDAEGALLIETGSCLRRIIAGDVSVRPAP